MGMLSDNNEWHQALAEAGLWATGQQLRDMYASMLMYCEVMLCAAQHAISRRVYTPFFLLVDHDRTLLVLARLLQIPLHERWPCALWRFLYLSASARTPGFKSSASDWVDSPQLRPSPAAVPFQAGVAVCCAGNRSTHLPFPAISLHRQASAWKA